MSEAKYTRIKLVGKGSFGQAFLVEHVETRKQYIMKRIQTSQMNRAERDEALNEVRLLSKLNHTNIVQYVESFTDSLGNLAIIMEYCSNGDLYAAIKNQQGRPFPEQQVLDWLVQMCLALKYCHDRKLLHRDIKTQNIFLTADNRIKIGDFGIARVLQNTLDYAKTVVGTPYFMSPELVQEKPYNNKSDIWSVGCVMYELLTHKHAFDAENMKGLVVKILRGLYPPISGTYSAELRRLVDMMLERDPRKRPSASSLLRKSFLRPTLRKFMSEEELVKLGLLVEDAPPFASHNVAGQPGMRVAPADAGRLRELQELEAQKRRQFLVDAQQPPARPKVRTDQERAGMMDAADAAGVRAAAVVPSAVPGAARAARPSSANAPKVVVVVAAAAAAPVSRVSPPLPAALPAGAAPAMHQPHSHPYQQQLLQQQIEMEARHRQYMEMRKEAERNKARLQYEVMSQHSDLVVAPGQPAMGRPAATPVGAGGAGGALEYKQDQWQRLHQQQQQHQQQQHQQQQQQQQANAKANEAAMIDAHRQLYWENRRAAEENKRRMFADMGVPMPPASVSPPPDELPAQVSAPGKDVAAPGTPVTSEKQRWKAEKADAKAKEDAEHAENIKRMKDGVRLAGPRLNVEDLRRAHEAVGVGEQRPFAPAKEGAAVEDGAGVRDEIQIFAKPREQTPAKAAVSASAVRAETTDTLDVTLSSDGDGDGLVAADVQESDADECGDRSDRQGAAANAMVQHECYDGDDAAAVGSDSEDGNDSASFEDEADCEIACKLADRLRLDMPTEEKVLLDGRTVRLPAASAESLAMRIENLRIHIEQCLGLDKFLEGYDAFQQDKSDTGEGADLEAALERILGTDGLRYASLINQLVFLEERLNRQE